MAHRWKVLAVVSVAVFMVGLDMFIVNVAFPQIERGLGRHDLAAVSWVLNAYAIVLAALMVPSGRLADRSGRRRVFLAGLLLFVGGSTLCGAAGSVTVLVAARAVQAAGAACLLPTSLALLLPEFPPAQRATAIGVWAAVGGVAAAFGPPIGGLLVHASWRLVFYVNVPIGLASLLVARRVLRESSDRSQRRPDLLGAGLLTASVGLLALALVKAPGWGWLDARTVCGLAGSVVGLALFWVRCHSHRSPVVDPALLRVRSYALANAAGLAFSAAFSAVLLGAVLFLTAVWHESMLGAGFSIAPGPLLAAAVAPVAGRVGNRVGQRNLAAAGIAVFAAGCAMWLWRAGTARDYVGDFLPGMLITGAGVGLTLPSLASAAAASLPPARFATGSAVFTMSRQVGFVLGVAVLIAVLGNTGATSHVAAFQHGWLFMVITSGIGAVLALGIGVVAPPLAVPTASAPAVAGCM